MNPLVIVPYLKYIGIAVLIGILGYFIWDIKSTYEERDKLTQTVATQNTSIKNLKDDVDTQKKLNAELLKRKEQLEAVELEFKKFVESNKKSNKKFIDNSKKELEEVRKKEPNKLDKYYVNKYNSILDCIKDTTANKETKCDTL